MSELFGDARLRVTLDMSAAQRARQSEERRERRAEEREGRSGDAPAGTTRVPRPGSRVPPEERAGRRRRGARGALSAAADATDARRVGQAVTQRARNIGRAVTAAPTAAGAIAGGTIRGVSLGGSAAIGASLAALAVLPTILTRTTIAAITGESVDRAILEGATEGFGAGIVSGLREGIFQTVGSVGAIADSFEDARARSLIAGAQDQAVDFEGFGDDFGRLRRINAAQAQFAFRRFQSATSAISEANVRTIRDALGYRPGQNAIEEAGKMMRRLASGRFGLSMGWR